MTDTDTAVQPTIQVQGDDCTTAIKHGAELWYDGSTPTKRLDQRGGRSGFTRFVNGRVEGKLSEVAFTRFLDEHFDIDAVVDWRIYGSYGQTDYGDCQYVVGDDGENYSPAVEFDVKKTKPWNQWLAIRTEIFDQHPADAPFVLTKLSLSEDIVLDEWADTGSWQIVAENPNFRHRLERYIDEHFPLDVRIVGTAYPDEFTDTFDQGDRLYDPDTGHELGGDLRRDNRGIHVSDLVATRDRWNRVADDIVGDNPISYDPL